MAHAERFMTKTPAGWIIACRPCGKSSKRRFDSPRECHDYWREHTAGAQHIEFSSHEFRIAEQERRRVAGLWAKLLRGESDSLTESELEELREISRKVSP